MYDFLQGFIHVSGSEWRPKLYSRFISLRECVRERSGREALGALGIRRAVLAGFSTHFSRCISGCGIFREFWYANVKWIAFYFHCWFSFRCVSVVICFPILTRSFLLSCLAVGKGGRFWRAFQHICLREFWCDGCGIFRKFGCIVKKIRIASFFSWIRGGRVYFIFVIIEYLVFLWILTLSLFLSVCLSFCVCLALRNGGRFWRAF